jgi:hypothetical protein
LAQGLAADAEGGGELGGARVAAGEGFEGFHGGRSIGRARRRVVWSPSWARLQLPLCQRQRVVDAAGFFKPAFVAAARGA